MLAPESNGTDVAKKLERPLAELVETYPPLKNYSDYLEFLSLTGGAHVFSQRVSLGIFGFAGYVVRSFGEGLCLDQERYFLFADLVFDRKASPNFFFAFDLTNERDNVYYVTDDDTHYRLYCDSFAEFLALIVADRYPGIDPR